MAYIYKNIAVDTYTELVNAADKFDVDTMRICNTGGADGLITLRINSVKKDDKFDSSRAAWNTAYTAPTGASLYTYNLYFRLELPDTTTLVLDRKDLEYDYKNYDLEIYSTVTVDVSLTNKNRTNEYTR